MASNHLVEHCIVFVNEIRLNEFSVPCLADTVRIVVLVMLSHSTFLALLNKYLALQVNFLFVGLGTCESRDLAVSLLKCNINSIFIDFKTRFSAETRMKLGNFAPSFMIKSREHFLILHRFVLLY